MGPKNCSSKIDEIYTLISLIYNFSTIKQAIKICKCHQFYTCKFLDPNTVSIPPIHIIRKSQTKNHQNSQQFVELYQIVMRSLFYILLKLLNT